MAKWLDKDGTSYLWGKIKSNFAFKSDAIKNITRSGTTFTATRADNTTFTFTQQDNNTNTTYTLTQDSSDGHKITLTPSSGNATTITIPDNNTTYNNATTSAAGLMSAADKSKLNGIASGAQVNSITGVKGNAETSYRTGDVNLTAVNVGAVDKTGDTMTGTLTLAADRYTDDNATAALKLRNSNIIGVNSIYTADLSDSAQEGIHFYRDATHVDSIHAKNGTLYFTPNRQLGTNGTSKQVLTSDGIPKSMEMQTTNPFAPPSLQGPYISKIDNAFYAADKRWTVTALIDGVTNLSASEVSWFFNGDYETRYQLAKSKTCVITLDFSNTTYFPGYPYGYVLISFYYNEAPASVSGRIYCNYESHGVGWHDISFSEVADSGSQSHVYKSAHQGYYNISKLEITVVASSSVVTGISQIEMHLDRPYAGRNPFLSKYGAETLYYDLTAPKFIGALQGNADTATNATKVNNHTVNKDVPSDAKFTDTVYTHPTTSGNKHIPSGGSSGQILRWSADGTATWGNDNNTTYSSKTAASGGTDVSLVTTGEKYTWNNKSNLALGTTATTAAAGNHTHDFITNQGRLTTADNLRGDGKLRCTIASSSMSTNKPLIGGKGATASVHDSQIIELPWDNNGGYDVQLAVSNDGAGLSIRGGTGKDGNAQKWTTWAPVAMASNAISNITRSGTTFTATRADGTTFTFTQQDNNTTYSFTDANPTLAWGTKSKVATVGGVDIHVTMPADPSETLGNIFDLIYPVGSIYMSVNSTSPETLFGGSWERITGKFLLSATDDGSTGTDVQSTASVAPGSSGGEATHTLTQSEIANHGHGHNISVTKHSATACSRTTNVGVAAHGITQPAFSTPKLTHSVTQPEFQLGMVKTAATGTAQWHGSAWADHTGAYTANRSTNVAVGDHAAAACSRTTNVALTNNHSVTQPTFNTPELSHTVSGGVSNMTGGGGAHNNMPPFLSVYVWKRVA